MLLECLPVQMQSECILKNFTGSFHIDFEKCADSQIVKITPRRKLAQIGADMVTVAPAAFGGDLEAAWTFLRLTHQETLTRRMGLSSLKVPTRRRRLRNL
jgi:hypothetical protein